MDAEAVAAVLDMVGAGATAAAATAAGGGDGFDDDSVRDTVDGQPTHLRRLIENGRPCGGGGDGDGGNDAALLVAVTPTLDALTAYVRGKYGCAAAAAETVLVRRYRPSERSRLEAHFDVTAFATAIVQLTDPALCRGGLYVQSVPGVASRRYVPLGAGDACVHRFDTMHGVHVPEGSRYTMVVWFGDGRSGEGSGEGSGGGVGGAASSEEAEEATEEANGDGGGGGGGTAAAPIQHSDVRVPWIEAAASRGNLEAQFILGGFHYRGEFGYGGGAAGGDMPSTAATPTITLTAPTASTPVEAAAYWLGEAARRGQPLAMLHLASMADEGEVPMALADAAAAAAAAGAAAPAAGPSGWLDGGTLAAAEAAAEEDAAAFGEAWAAAAATAAAPIGAPSVGAAAASAWRRGGSGSGSSGGDGGGTSAGSDGVERLYRLAAALGHPTAMYALGRRALYRARQAADAAADAAAAAAAPVQVMMPRVRMPPRRRVRRRVRRRKGPPSAWPRGGYAARWSRARAPPVPTARRACLRWRPHGGRRRSSKG